MNKIQNLEEGKKLDKLKKHYKKNWKKYLLGASIAIPAGLGLGVAGSAASNYLSNKKEGKKPKKLGTAKVKKRNTFSNFYRES